MKAILFTLAIIICIVNAQPFIDGSLYQITCMASFNFLTIENEQTTNGANLIAYPLYTHPSQFFTLNFVDGKWATLVARHSGKALTTSANTVGAKITQEDLTGLANQQFRFLETKNGNTLIQNRASGLYLNCNSARRSEIDENHILVIQEARDCSWKQRFMFEEITWYPPSN